MGSGKPGRRVGSASLDRASALWGLDRPLRSLGCSREATYDGERWMVLRGNVGQDHSRSTLVGCIASLVPTVALFLSKGRQASEHLPSQPRLCMQIIREPIDIELGPATCREAMWRSVWRYLKVSTISRLTFQAVMDVDEWSGAGAGAGAVTKWRSR